MRRHIRALAVAAAIGGLLFVLIRFPDLVFGTALAATLVFFGCVLTGDDY